MTKLGRDFWLFAVGRWISIAGWAIQDVAIPLYVLDKTGSGTMMSLFVMAELIPRILVNPIAGVIGDRYNRKYLMVGFDLIRGVLLFFVLFFNLLELEQLLVIQVIMSIFGSFFAAGTSGMFPDLVPKDRLMQANSILQMGTQVINIVSPVIGGAIYGLGGIKAAIFINAISFFGSGLFEISIRYEWKGKGEKFAILREFLDGIKLIKSSKPLLILGSLSIILNALFSPLFAIVFPYIVRVVLRLSSIQFGSVQTALTLGMLLGNLIIASILKNSAGKHFMKAILIQELFILIVPFTPKLSYPRNYLVILTSAFAIGFFNVLVNIPIMTKLQTIVPREYRARFFSTLETLSMGATPLGMIIVGPTIDKLGYFSVSITLTIVGIAISVYYWLRYSRILKL
ncbi:MFS transporter [Pyrococcus abyssi]|uniref:Glucose-dependent multidrug resistance protein (Multidrug-efflux transporter) n=1 Tax=Pyrococcus abyssi (strain GE5 / Orsay) TaxID=272844 RepID=Q9UZK8_PYRAB|nr:MFS transporter [Pyrococcus abyssi]CAB50049.1 Glucose-dependent multidrug resistance protein (multidrug-efflux transporter) [Pyrococcus abyssi GE5]CCE70553.1 TPA: macrolide-efflux determinant related [Pyrococcus abyssi GE5]